MASSRKKGTNENISTYGAAGFGRDYTVLATWEAATDNDLVTAAQSEVLECYKDAASFNDFVNLGGAICNASYFRVIRPAGTKGQSDWQGHDGTPNDGIIFVDTVAEDTINSDDEYTRIEDIVAKTDLNTGTSSACFKRDNGDSPLFFIGCIAQPSNDGAGVMMGFEDQADTAQETFFINCLAIDCDRTGFEKQDPGDTYHYNCTAVGCRNGFERDNASGVCDVKNCLADNSTNNDFLASAGSFTGNNNASSDATAPGTGPRINQTFTFQAAGSDDYHLDINDAGARDYGADLSSDADFPFDDDIDWRLRVAAWSWDIGADEYFSAYPIISDRQPLSLIFGNRIVR